MYRYLHDVISKKLHSNKLLIYTCLIQYLAIRVKKRKQKNIALYHNLLSIFSLNLFSSLAIFLSRPNFAVPTWVDSFGISVSFVSGSARDPKSSWAVAVGFNEATRTSLYFVWTYEQQIKTTLIQHKFFISACCPKVSNFPLSVLTIRYLNPKRVQTHIRPCWRILSMWRNHDLKELTINFNK